jgi:hypothetical protein
MSNLSTSLLNSVLGQRDWRIWFGVVVTVFWIGGGVVYLSTQTTSGTPTMSDVGNFLEGAFAPLAFLWLVLGLFIQQRELTNNTEALRHTSIQSEKQTHAIAATEMNARRETFFQIANAVRRQLGSMSGMLFVSSQGEVGNGNVSSEAISEFWQQHATGDYEVFSRQFLIINFPTGETLQELFYGTAIRTKHSENFCHTFERLKNLAADCDIEGIIEDSLNYGGHGLLYRRLLTNRPPN